MSIQISANLPTPNHTIDKIFRSSIQLPSVFENLNITTSKVVSILNEINSGTATFSYTVWNPIDFSVERTLAFGALNIEKKSDVFGGVKYLLSGVEELIAISLYYYGAQFNTNTNLNKALKPERIFLDLITDKFIEIDEKTDPALIPLTELYSTGKRLALERELASHYKGHILLESFIENLHDSLHKFQVLTFPEFEAVGGTVADAWKIYNKSKGVMDSDQPNPFRKIKRDNS